MEVEGEKPSSLPSNYVTIHQLKERWLQQQQQQKSPSKPKPENPKLKPNENAIKPTNTQNQRPNFGRVTKEHKLKEVKVDDNGSTSKTLVVDDMKNPYKNDATKHNQRPNYRPVTNQPKAKVDNDGTASKTLVAVDLKNPKIKPMADDDGLSTKDLVVDVTDNKLNGENETGDSKFNLKKNKKKSKSHRRNSNVVTDQNPTGTEPEPGAKVVEEKVEKRSCINDKNPEVEMVEEKGKDGRRYGRGNGNSRFGAEPERKMEPEKEAEVVEEKMKKKSYPTDKNPEAEMVEEKGKEGRRYGRGNGNLRFGAEPERKMEPEKEAEVVEEKMKKKSYPTDKNPEAEMVEEKGKDGRRYGRGNGNLRFGAEPERKMEPEKEAEVVEEKMKKKSYPTDKNPEAEMVEEKGKEGRRYGRGNGNLRFGAEPERKMEPEKEAEVVEEKMKKKSYPTDKNPEAEMVEEKGKEGRRYGRGNGNLRFGAEPERKMEPETEAEVVEEKMQKKSYGRGKPADQNPIVAEPKPETEEEVVEEKGKWGRGYGRRNGNSKVVWEQKEKTAPIDENGGGGGGGDGVVEEVVKERNVGQGRNRNGGYGRDRNWGHGRERNWGYGRDRNGGYGRDKKMVPSGSFGEQQRLIWVKKGESVVPT